MKITVTYENGQVFQHFGRTQQFKVYEVQDSKIISSQVVGCDGASHCGVGNVLQQIGADMLICGGMGMGARNMLANMGIKVLSGITGDADIVVEAYLRGEICTDPEAGVHACHGH